MRVRPIGLILLTFSFAAACSDDRETVVYGNPATGEQVTLRTGEAVAAPTNLPAFAPVYPGAQIENVLQGNSSDTTGAQRGGMVTFRTDDAPDTVAAFYRGRLDASGLSERSDANLNGTVMLSATASDDTDRGVQVSIAPATDAPGSQVTLVYNPGQG